MRKAAECRKCRRVGTKLFLKSEKCESQKCPMIKKPYSPGEKPKKRKSRLSQYGKELIEKQKLRSWYCLKEKQFVRYIKETTSKKNQEEEAGDRLIRTLEKRLDNIVYRSGLSSSRLQGKQMISHGFFHVNGNSVDRSSYQINIGDVISVRPNKKKSKIFTDFKTNMKNFTPPSWISLDKDKLQAKITGNAIIDEIAPPVEISSIFEFYSR